MLNSKPTPQHLEHPLLTPFIFATDSTYKFIKSCPHHPRMWDVSFDSMATWNSGVPDAAEGEKEGEEVPTPSRASCFSPPGVPIIPRYRRPSTRICAKEDADPNGSHHLHKRQDLQTPARVCRWACMYIRQVLPELA